MEIESPPAAPATTTTAATAGNVGWIFAVVSIVLIPFAIFGLVNAVPWVAKPRVQLQKIRVNGSRSDPFGPSSRVTATFILSNTNWVCLKYDLLSTSLVYNGITIANDMKPGFSQQKGVANDMKPGFSQQKGGRDYVDCEFTTIYTFGRSSTSLSVRAVLTAYYRVSGFPRFLVGDFYHDLRIGCDVVVAQDPRHPTIFTASSPRCKIV